MVKRITVAGRTRLVPTHGLKYLSLGGKNGGPFCSERAADGCNIRKFRGGLVKAPLPGPGRARRVWAEPNYWVLSSTASSLAEAWTAVTGVR
jgi:hypothetical protein